MVAFTQFSEYGLLAKRKKEGGSLDINYVSMHAIQRRMEAAGLGHEADVSAILDSEKRNAQLDAFRSVWEPRIRAEVEHSVELNALQQKFLTKIAHLRRGTTACFYWLAEEGVCYVVSAAQEVVTVFPVDNRSSETLEHLKKKAVQRRTRLQSQVQRSQQTCLLPNCPNKAIIETPFCKHHELCGSSDTNIKRCRHKKCVQPRLPNTLFCAEHKEIGPAHLAYVEKIIHDIESTLTRLRAKLQRIRESIDSDNAAIEARGDAGRCSYLKCIYARLSGSAYCREHVAAAYEREVALQRGLTKTSKTIATYEKQLADMQTKLPLNKESERVSDESSV